MFLERKSKQNNLAGSFHPKTTFKSERVYSGSSSSMPRIAEESDSDDHSRSSWRSAFISESGLNRAILPEKHRANFGPVGKFSRQVSFRNSIYSWLSDLFQFYPDLIR
jgi:hypothetical protein